MKILLCTKHDLIGGMMLNMMLPRLVGEHQVSVVLANRQRPENASIPELRWMKLFEQDLPARLLWPMLDARGGSVEGSREGWLSFDGMSRKYEVPVVRAGHIAHHSTLTALVREAQPDLVVSFQFGFLFRKEALEVPTIGALNLHSGPLPERAGLNPTFWIMKDGDPETACTLHWIDAGIDSGNLVEVRRMPIDYSRSFFANWIANYCNGVEVILDAIGTLADGRSLPSTPQVPGSRVYVPTATQADLDVFVAAGRRMIDPDDVLSLLSAWVPAGHAETP